MGVNSVRKEFAPRGANSYHQELTLFFKGIYFVHKGNQEVTKLSPFVKWGEKDGGDPIYLTDSHCACLSLLSITLLSVFVSDTYNQRSGPGTRGQRE